MKFKHLPLLLATMAMALFSCTKGEEDKAKEEPQPGPDDKPVVVDGKITLDEDALNVGLAFGAAEGSMTLQFSVNKEWTAASSESWATVTPESGAAGDVTVTVAVTANEGYDARTATLTLTCDKDVQRVAITQMQKDAMVIAPETITVPAAGKDFTLKLQSNVEVTATSDVDWIAVAETKGLVEHAYAVVVFSNEEYEPRTGHVTFTSTVGTQTITFEQEAAEKPEEPEEPAENPYGEEELPMITATTTWAGSVFDALIDANAAGTNEWISDEGVNFIDAGLGYLAGKTTAVDETTGEEKTTLGKFKFKKAEKAYVDGTKMSRVQMGGTGVLGKRNLLQFKVNGPGALTVIGRSSGDAERKINVAVGSEPVSEEGFALPGKASDSKTVSLAVEAAEGDIVSLYSMESGINFYSIKWVPGGKPEDPGDDPGTNPEQPGELTALTEATVFAPVISELVAKYPAEDYPDGVTESFVYGNLGFVAGGGKFKFGSDSGFDRAQLGGTGVPGTKTTIQFKVAGPGALTVLARSSGDDARPLMVAVGTREVGSKEVPAKTGDITDCIFNVEAASGDLVNIYSGKSGINVYEIKWNPGATVDPGDNPGDDPQPGEGDELDCPNPPTVGMVEMDKLYGYGAGVTGGEGASAANVLHFNSGKALQTWLLARTKTEKKGDHSPVIIWLSGTFVPTDGRDFSEAHPWFDVKDVSNLSFYGTDDFVMDRIGIFCVRAKNIIIRNINFRQPKANNGADAVSMQECDGVWVDHCSFTSLNQTKDYEDGSTDVTHASKNVTVSWCHYVKTQKSCLVGHSNGASADAAITATFHHNWFDQSNSRHPRVRFGKVHVYNNLYDNNATYGVGSAYGAKVLVEYNYFDGVRLPTDICTYPAKPSGSSMVSNLTGSVAGYLYATQDVYVNKPANASNPYPFTNVAYTKYGGTAGTPLTYDDFKPSYDYVVTAAEDVPSVVREGAGYGKLGWSSAPVEVNNGGITEFNGSDDDPTTPDPSDPDDPDDPGDDPGVDPATPGTHVLYVDDSKKIVNDGYFTPTESIADFSKDYDGPFTIDGTSYSYGLKMDSKGSVTFTTSATLNTTVQFYAARRKASGTSKMQLTCDGADPVIVETEHGTPTGSGELTLEKGKAYTLAQKTSEQGLILVIVKETE